MERRSAKRTKALLSGRIIFNNRCSVLECTIKDISEAGARLALAGTAQIPPDFELDIPKRGVEVNAHVKWVHGNEYGVFFSVESDADSDSTSEGSDETLSNAVSTDGLPINPRSAEIQHILDTARTRVAALLGLSVSEVQLKLMFDETPTSASDLQTGFRS